MTVGSGNKCLVLSTELQRLFAHGIETRVLTFRVLALCQAECGGLTLEAPALKSLHDGQITLKYP